MRSLSRIRRLFVSEKRSKDLKPSDLMYGGDTRTPTFIFKLVVFKWLPCLCHSWQFASISKKERWNVISFGFCFLARRYASGFWRTFGCHVLLYFSSIVYEGDIVSRWKDIWREGLIKLVFCGGRDVNEPLSNETDHCGLNNGCFRLAIVSIIENEQTQW